MQKGNRWNLFSSYICDAFSIRVKHFCAICYPNVDQLTQTQLKRMRKCRHGMSKISMQLNSVRLILFLALQSADNSAADGSPNHQSSTIRDKDKGTVL